MQRQAETFLYYSWFCEHIVVRRANSHKQSIIEIIKSKSHLDKSVTIMGIVYVCIIWYFVNIVQFPNKIFRLFYPNLANLENILQSMDLCGKFQVVMRIKLFRYFLQFCKILQFSSKMFCKYIHLISKNASNLQIDKV